MADVLLLLRDYNIHKKEIFERDDLFIFGELAWPKKAKTNFLIWSNEPGAERKKEYYTLESIMFLLRNVSTSHPQYVKQAVANNVIVVKLPDRKDLLAYLRGEIDTCGSIDKSGPLEMPVPLKRAQLPAHTSEAVTVPEAKKARVEEEHGETDRPLNVPASDEKHRLAIVQKLSAPSSDVPSIVNPDELQGLSLGGSIPIETLAAIRAKFMAKKRQTIRPSTVDQTESAPQGSSAVDAAIAVGSSSSAPQLPGSNSESAPGAPSLVISDGSAVPSSSQPRVLSDAHLTREYVISRERLAATRNSVLTTPLQLKESLLDAMLNMVRTAKAKEEGRDPKAHQPAPIPEQPAINKSKQQTSSYNRYDQERFAARDQTTGEFKIDTQLTYHGLSLKSMAESSGGAPPTAMTTPGRTPNPYAGLGGKSPAPGSATPRATPVVPASPAPHRAFGLPFTPKATPMGATPLIAAPGNPQKRQSRTPIIVIPSGPNNIITMYNAKDILQDLRFVSSDEKRQGGARRDNEVLLQRQKGEVTVPYRVIDTVNKLSAEEWDRVVAVFVQGPAWQFKDWPVAGGNPTEIFNHIRAFHLKWRELPLDGNIRKWDVAVLELDRHKRHLDRATLQDFWNILDKWMAKNRPNLRF